MEFLRWCWKNRKTIYGGGLPGGECEVDLGGEASECHLSLSYAHLSEEETA